MPSEPVQTILVPFWDELPEQALTYAKMLSEAYRKPVSILCLNPLQEDFCKAHGVHYRLSNKKLAEALDETINEQDCVMVVWQHNGRSTRIQAMLNASRHLRIPYFFISKKQRIAAPKRVALPVGFLIENREKATWGRSLNRYFQSQFSILKPKDKGSRSAKNVAHIEAFFDKHDIIYQSIQGRRSSFKNDNEALALLSHQVDLMLLMASREYGLDDQFFGPEERRIIKRSPVPLMLLNPRDDLYVLCGD